MKKVLIYFIRAYQFFLSPVAACLGARCRFEVCCSDYALNAVKTLPLHKAVYSSLARIASCRPGAS